MFFEVMLIKQNMAADFYTQYGYCIVPKGTCFCRGGLYQKNDAFFAFDEVGAYAYAPDAVVQYWQVVQDFKVLLAITQVDEMHRAFSALGVMYSHDLGLGGQHQWAGIKQNQKLRQPLVDALRRRGLVGLVTSVADLADLELWLFPEADSIEAYLAPIAAEHPALNDRQTLPILSTRFYPAPALFANSPALPQEATQAEALVAKVKQEVADAAGAGVPERTAYIYYYRLTHNLLASQE